VSRLERGVQQVTGVFKDNVTVFPYDVPPPLSETLSWRQLWRSGGFALLDLVWDTSFSGLAADCGLHLGIGQRPLETLDIQGALQPIAFAAGGNPHGFVDLTPFEPRMTFREEEPPRKWSATPGTPTDGRTRAPSTRLGSCSTWTTSWARLAPGRAA
jgi:hypothetical protein